MAKSALAGDLFTPTLMERCTINQKLTLHSVAKLLAEEDGYDEKEINSQLQACVA